MQCKVIITYGNAETAGFESRGDLLFDGAGNFALNYGFGGDMCRLAYDGKVLNQSRRGKMQTDIRFIKGTTTDCLTADTEHGYNCVLKVYTNEISYSKTQNGLKLKVDYTIEDSPIILILTAEFDKEKK